MNYRFIILLDVLAGFSLLLLIGLSHESGHVVFYNLLNFDLYSYGLGAWVENTGYGLTMKAYYFPSFQKPLVFAGGLIFSLPFSLLLKNKRVKPITKMCVLIMLVYGIIETIFGITLFFVR